MRVEKEQALKIPDIRLDAEKLCYRFDPNIWERAIYMRLILARNHSGESTLRSVQEWKNASVEDDKTGMRFSGIITFKEHEPLSTEVSILAQETSITHNFTLNTAFMNRATVGIRKLYGLKTGQLPGGVHLFFRSEGIHLSLCWETPLRGHGKKTEGEQKKYLLPEEEAYLYARMLRLQDIDLRPAKNKN